MTPWMVAHQAPLSIGFLRQEYWNGLPFPFPGDLPNPWVEPGSPAQQVDSLLTELPGKESDVPQLCLILCGPMDSSLLGSSIHGVFQARILEWVAISFSKGATREALYIYVLIFKSIFNLDTKFSLKIIRI